MSKQIKGKLTANPYGNWRDVDRGLYVGSERVADCGCDFWQEFEGKLVRVTVDVLNESDELFYQCVRLGADPGAVAGWPDFKRERYINEHALPIKDREDV